MPSVHGHGNGHGLVHRARGIDRGAPGFVREADEVGIGKAVVLLDLRQGGTLAVAEVDHRLVLGDRHQAGGQDHQVGFEDHIVAQEGVLGGNLQPAVAGQGDARRSRPWSA